MTATIYRIIYVRFTTRRDEHYLHGENATVGNMARELSHARDAFVRRQLSGVLYRRENVILSWTRYMIASTIGM